jgi:hypothetical protein
MRGIESEKVGKHPKIGDATLFGALLTEQISEAMVGLNSGQPAKDTT